MENLPRIVAAYEKMDKQARDKYVLRMEQSAIRYPMQVQQRANLRLVTNENR